MYKKAQNIIEIALLTCVIVALAVTVLSIYNNQKIKLAEFSKSNVSTQSVNPDKPVNPNDLVPYKAIETAGSNALAMLEPPITGEQYSSYMANITYKNLDEALGSDGEKGLAELANKIIKELNLPYTELSADKVDLNTLSTLTGVLNSVADPKYKGDADTAGEYVDKLQALLNTVSDNFK